MCCSSCVLDSSKMSRRLVATVESEDEVTDDSERLVSTAIFCTVLSCHTSLSDREGGPGKDSGYSASDTELQLKSARGPDREAVLPALATGYRNIIKQIGEDPTRLVELLV